MFKRLLDPIHKHDLENTLNNLYERLYQLQVELSVTSKNSSDARLQNEHDVVLEKISKYEKEYTERFG